MKVKDWFTDENKWTKNTAFRDKEGKEILKDIFTDLELYKDSIDSCCLLGAIDLCYSNNDELKFNVIGKLEDKINEGRNGEILDIIEWNDSEYTTFKNIKDLVEELDI